MTTEERIKAYKEIAILKLAGKIAGKLDDTEALLQITNQALALRISLESPTNNEGGVTIKS